MGRLQFYWTGPTRYHDSERCEGYALDAQHPEASRPRSGSESRAQREGRVYCSTCRRKADAARGVATLADEMVAAAAEAIRKDDRAGLEALIATYGQRLMDALPDLHAQGVRRGKDEA